MGWDFLEQREVGEEENSCQQLKREQTRKRGKSHESHGNMYIKRNRLF